MTSKKSRRERILIAARSLIAKEGLHSLRMSDVASVADVSPQLLSYHFPSRLLLLTAALDYAAEQAPSTNLLHQPPGASALDTLRAALLAEFDDQSSVRELNLVWNEVAALPHADDVLHARLLAVTRDWNDQVTIGVMRCVVEGSIDTDLEPERIAAILTAAVEGLSQRWLAGTLGVDGARTALESLLSAFARGPRT